MGFYLCCTDYKIYNQLQLELITVLWIENSHSVHKVDAFKRPTAHRLAGPNALGAGLSKKRL